MAQISGERRTIILLTLKSGSPPPSTNITFPPCPTVFQYRKTVADAVQKRLSSDLGHSDPSHTPKRSPKRNIASPLTRSATRRIATGNDFQPETTGNPNQSSTSVPQKTGISLSIQGTSSTQTLNFQIPPGGVVKLMLPNDVCMEFSIN